MATSLETVTSTARALGVSSSTVRWLADKGCLKAFRDASGRRLFFTEDVERLKAEREAKARKRAEA